MKYSDGHSQYDRQSVQSVVDLLFFENITDRIINGFSKIHTNLLGYSKKC